MIILFLFFGFLQLIRTDNTFFKCSPLDGELDTYSFISNSEMGIACVRGSGQSDLVFYIEKQGTDGLKKMAKSMLCAMKSGSHSGYHAMYGFGLRQNERNAWHPYFYLGQSLNPMAPSGSLNVAPSLFEVCLQSDCTRCRKGLKSMTLTS